MADSKITALTAISTVDPTADPLVIVDVSDTSMAASGTTKKSTINQLLGSGGTATLASATITGDLTVRTNKLAVTSTGVGVGTVSPGQPLDIVSDSGANGIIIRGRSADDIATLNFATNAASVAAQIQMRPGGNELRYLVTGAKSQTFYTNGSEQMRIDSSGNVGIANGNLVMSTSGKGIDFSATPNSGGTMTSELLNDYEEGSWTPSITFGGASVGMTGTFAGRYTKVGRAVTINGIIALTAKGSSTGIAKISGLPFTSANASGEYTAISIRLDRVSFADFPCGYVGPNSSVVELENTTNAGTVSSMTDSNFINTSVVIVNFTYTV